eukprot:TRINITY_DN5824_c0_g1_i1.p1 TRINITY_DN5824_c0_g1~~TRINITY_DN5824_c0_g1_i1.p1  ORF type:complete len:346 (+),score=59.12 TRINITY_DN5824_c0_g1_i1:336-1373(+)
MPCTSTMSSGFHRQTEPSLSPMTSSLLPSSHNNIIYREFRPEDDLDQVRQLHGVCFPIEYDDSYYNFLVKGGDNVYCIVAVIDEMWDEGVRTPSSPSSSSPSPIFRELTELPEPTPPPAVQQQAPYSTSSLSASSSITHGLQSSILLPTGTVSAVAMPSADRERDHTSFSSTPIPMKVASQSRQLVVGFIVAQYSTCWDDEDNAVIGHGWTNWNESELLYILTLGVSPRHRRKGIASRLLQQIRVDVSLGLRPNCRGIYLHVWSDNEDAMLFYERHGYERLCLLMNYYVIKGVRCHAYLYASYTNGGHAHYLMPYAARSVMDAIDVVHQNTFGYVWSIVSKYLWA